MKNPTIGQMRVPITVKSVTRGVGTNGNPTEAPVTLFATRCHWSNAHGTEAFENLRLELGEIATITMRYSSLVAVKCLIYYGSDAWEVVSIDNIEQRNRWLEIKVKRVVVA
ncbi:MAG: head-tail adaptor protein [Clostridiaceae bacterium]